MTDARPYLKSHPWLTFTLDLRRLPVTTWTLLGEAVSKCEHLAGTLLTPSTAKELTKVYLAKGAMATTAIEGNTLTEEEVRGRIDGSLKLPRSKEYLGVEVDNIIRASNVLLERHRSGALAAPLTVNSILEMNKMVLDGIDVEDHVLAGSFRKVSVGVADYRGAPAGDLHYLMEKACEWINEPWLPDEEGYGQRESRRLQAVLKAIIGHLYLAWIHPFGDGNGRTARLLEFYILLREDVPFPAAHLLSNHYNETRSEYYRQLSYASKSGGDVSRFITYAVQGFVDQLRQQIAVVRDKQHEIFWENYVHQLLGDSETGRRRRYLVMDLAAESPAGLPKAKLREVTMRVFKHYNRFGDRTLDRDVDELVASGLLIRRDNRLVANRDIVQAFLPEQDQRKTTYGT